MEEIKLLIQAGSGNRGCEAIVRGTYEIYGKDFNLTVFSAKIDQDKNVGLDKIVKIKNGESKYNKIIGFIKHIENYVSYKYGNGKRQIKNLYTPLIKDITKDDITMIIGGDVYCYGKPYVYYRFNDLLHSKFKIFYGCSIEPKSIDEEMKHDLSKYNLIITRESISYDALIDNNVKNVYLLPDPAFSMKTKEVKLNSFFNDGEIIGINLSPLISALGSNKNIVFDSYVNMIEYILTNTKYKIALIPHVIWENGNDYLILKELFETINDKRLFLVSGEYAAEELKYIIGKCSMFVGARTHATIAAYSQCIPTLVIGYSVKARGIAKDLFGTEKNYVFSVQDISNTNDLLKPLQFLIDNKLEIKKHLENIMPNYIQKSYDAVKILKEKLNNM